MKPYKELLELAAKAAGIPILAWNDKIPAIITTEPKAWLAQQEPSSYQELADAFVLLWLSDDRAAWDKKAAEHFDALLAKVESGYLAPTAIPEGWSPIETAPKDGTAVLVMRDIWPGTKSGRAEDCNGHNTYVSAWWAGERNGNGAWICYIDAVQDPECPVEPTHWQPLPPPPGEKK